MPTTRASSSPVQVRQLDPGCRADVTKFVAFPFALYRHCAQWVPPLVSSARTLLDRRKHPFYRHSEADFFVAERAGQVVGRIAALENRHYNAYHHRRSAFFGYFEVIEDEAVAQALLETALAWAKSRDLEEVIGPRGLLGVDGSVLVEGFEHRPALGIPYNYPYYDAFIKAAGFEKDTDYLSGYRWVNHPLSERFYRIAEKVKTKRNLWVKDFSSKAELRQWLPRLIEVHHEAFSQLHSYYPPTAEEIGLVVDTLLTIADPNLVKLVMQHDQIIGFLLAYHDISAALQRSQGRLWPFGWYHLLTERKRTKWVNVNAVGLLPSHRGIGANMLLYTELKKALSATNFRHLDMVQINEQNTNSLADIENIGVHWYKRHRHYRRLL